MIGVILWQDTAVGKAVVWCEDQGDLAFFNARETTRAMDDLLEVGDVVRFESRIEDNLRIATNVTKLLENWGSLLQDSLSRLPDEPDGVSEGSSAQIVPLRAYSLRQAPARRASDLRKHG